MNLTGKKFHRWTVVSRAPDRIMKCGQKYISWNCICECGGTGKVSQAGLKSGESKSCGCFAREVASKCHKTHGKTGTPEHHAWLSMKARCTVPTHHAFSDYGKRGIRVCDEWYSNFESFLRDVGLRPSRKHSLDRYPDNDGNYEPGNVRWATHELQTRNTRANVYLTAFGETKCLMEWSHITGIGRGKIRSRIARGWSVEKTLSEPAHIR